MQVFLNGKEMDFVDGGYEYVFIKPYHKHYMEKINRSNGELHIQLYDNGVQIRTLVTNKEVSTLINREVVVDRKNKQVYILEEDTEYTENEDGSIIIEDGKGD